MCCTVRALPREKQSACTETAMSETMTPQNMCKGGGHSLQSLEEEDVEVDSFSRSRDTTPCFVSVRASSSGGAGGGGGGT